MLLHLSKIMIAKWCPTVPIRTLIGTKIAAEEVHHIETALAHREEQANKGSQEGLGQEGVDIINKGNTK